MRVGPERWRRAARRAAVVGWCALALGCGQERGPREGAPEVGSGAVPALVADPGSLARVDLRRVHEELIPAWVAASPEDRDSAFGSLLEEGGREPGLRAALVGMDRLARTGPEGSSRELLAWVRAWNDLLAGAGEPWRLGGEVLAGPGGGRWILKSYRILWSDGEATAGGREVRVELRRRADPLGLQDPWLGHVRHPDEGVVLLLDRLTSFALDEVWPLLDPLLEPELEPLSRAFAAPLRATAREALGAGRLETLAATASDRTAMLEAVRRIHARHACGSSFAVSRLPWSGLSPRELASLRAHVGGSEQPCPEVQAGEALLFAARSGHLRATPELRPALEALVAWVARPIVAHEARHAADTAGLGAPLRCEACPREAGPSSAAEASAYLASFQDPAHGPLAMFQACGVDAALAPGRAALIGFLASRLSEGGCAAGPPSDLADRARTLERELLGPERASPAVVRLGPFPMDAGVEGR